jgi:spermidine synthase
VLLGQLSPAPIDVDEIERRLKLPEYAPVARSRAAIGMSSAVDLFATFAGQAPDFAAWLADAEINRDRNLRLQYLAGRGLNLYRADRIYADLLRHSKAPDAVFTGSDEVLQALLQRVRSAWGR